LPIRNSKRAQRFYKADACDLILKGYIAFLAPPKESAGRAIRALQKHVVTVKVLTGNNDLVTRKVYRELGLNADDIRLGDKVETMTDDDLAEAAERTHIFARLSPGHKQRIIRALQKMQHVVGFHDDLTANHLLHVYIFPPAKSNTSPATAP